MFGHFCKFLDMLSNFLDIWFWSKYLDMLSFNSLKNSLRRGPTGPSSLAPATQDKLHPFIIFQWSWFVQLLLCCKQFYASLDDSVRRNALMQVKTILCGFGQICATRNTLMKLKTIWCEFGQICTTRNALMKLKTILCKFWQICATRNALKQRKQFYASLDRSVQQETLLCSWIRIHANCWQ